MNCGHNVEDRYCSHCGQENANPKESFSHLVGHFVADVLHYDSKFLITLKYLFFKPGKLTAEYSAGKRVSYVNPIKLYIFISFIFFVVNGMIRPHFDPLEVNHNKSKKEEKKELRAASDTLKHAEEAVHTVKSDDEKADSILADVSRQLNKAGALPDSVKIKKDYMEYDSLVVMNSEKRKFYKTVAEYEAAQLALAPEKRDGFFTRRLFIQVVYSREKYGNNFLPALADKFMHNLSKVMFFLLPLFALILKLFYDRKRFLYIDHAIFALHYHCFVFLVMLIAALGNHFLHVEFFTTIAVIVIPLYLLISLHTVYGGTWSKAFWKAVGITFLYIMVISLVLACYAVLTFAFI
ncbi:uncharacterized protein DUF3667 [Chitinophaga skermanii]|uniref:Uncharacterized protein DUF3667 n=1 Tax=Chitinophaga skermanii TaxID=331697 RepID=A0A327QG84_9BACT|nr:uncharacterized protein DUF3667 [Chitinophaga skermanii]